ncbi:MAG: alpha/beta fold hydrolase [Gemmatimonadaceae bacterium]
MAVRGRLWPIIRRVWVTVGLTATAIFVAWSLIAYRADTEARRAAVSDSAVTVRYADGVWRFEGASPAKEPTLVFFPGSLVDPRAYAPLAKAVATEGHRVVIVELPRRGVFGGADSPELRIRVDSVLSSLGDSGGFVLGGHSRGGVVASTAASRQGSNMKGLVLIGTTHPRDVNLSGISVPVTKIVGTRDGLARPADVRQNAPLLPQHTRWVWIEGGNHSQFGWYGFQPMDRRPRIDAADQRALMIDGVVDLLRGTKSP